MSEKNVELVRHMYRAFHGGDAEGALACFDPDVYVDASERVDGGIGRGRDHLNRITTRWIGTWEGWSEEIEQIRDLGNHVYVVATQRGRGKGSGLEVENRYAILYEIVGDQIGGMKVFQEPAEALEAAGAAEQADAAGERIPGL